MELYKTLYISVTLHIIVLFLIGGIIRYNDPASTVNKEGIITAEIITEPESKNKKIYNKKLRNKITSPVNAFSNFYNDNITVVDLGEHPVIQLSEQSIRKPDNISSYLETGIKVETPEVVRNRIAMIGPVSFYGNEKIRKIRDSIEKAKIYPLLARKKGIEGKVILRFRIKPNGEVEEVRILKGSGFEILDKISIETIKRAAPLPYMRDWIEIPLVFRLE